METPSKGEPVLPTSTSAHMSNASVLCTYLASRHLHNPVIVPEDHQKCSVLHEYIVHGECILEH